MKKWLKRVWYVFLILILVLIVFIYFNLRERHKQYELDLTLKSNSQSGQLLMGFSAFPITPKVVDTWNDINGDAEYNEKDGDTFNDLNNNGKFDAIWIAGFSQGRPANGIHDQVWARAMVADEGGNRIALVVLDAIGFGYDDVIDIRKKMLAELGIDYTIVISTHTHESNDLVGIWGPSPLKSGINKENMSFVKSQAIKSVAKAVEKMRPVKLRFAQDLEGASHLTMDTRKPIVKDPGLRIMQAVDAETGMTQGVLASWGSHPETLWSKNLMISSDYPHYFREGLEKGVYAGDSLVIAGLGGTAIFVNGAIGGLMCTRGSMPIESVFSDTVFTEPNFDKIEEQGKQLAMLSLKALKNKPFYSQTSKLSVRAKTVELAMKNKIFFLAAGLGLLDRGMSGWQKMKTEVAAFKIGKASFLCVPGEIYPELVNGGIDAPKGQDFNISPVEIPPLRELMPGKFKFVFGLANDEIGYIIPKSEWDNKEPFLYDGKKTYGEINSFGPETAPSLHRAFKNILEELN